MRTVFARVFSMFPFRGGIPASPEICQMYFMMAMQAGIPAASAAAAYVASHNGSIFPVSRFLIFHSRMRVC